VAVGGEAEQCFDASGTNGSNPGGFANYDSSGTPQPYAPGLAVTQPIVADDQLTWASDSDMADTTGLIMGTVKLGFTSIKGAVGAGVAGPGAIVSGVLDIAMWVVANTCDGAPNLMGLAAAEGGGGVSGGSFAADEEGFGDYDTTVPGLTPGSSSSTANGVQLQPSTTTYNGSALYLAMYVAEREGVQSGSCVGACPNNNQIDLVMSEVNGCEGTALLCNVQPFAGPQVTNATGDVNCGTNNTLCPFPAAGWPPSGTQALDNPCETIVPTNLTVGPVNNGGAPGYTSPNGDYSLVMQSNGHLQLIDNADGHVDWDSTWKTQPDQATSTTKSYSNSWYVMQSDGNLVVYGEDESGKSGSTVEFASNTAGNTGAYLAVQNEGAVVVYSSSGQSLFANITPESC
jgi:hypothetical protein